MKDTLIGFLERQPYRVPSSTFPGRSMSVVGPAGGGKTTVISGLLYDQLHEDTSMLLIDGASALYHKVEPAVARGAAFASTVSPALGAAFVARHHFLDLANPTTGFNALRRLVGPDGIREHPTVPAGRFVSSFSGQFEDMPVRVLFTRTVRAITTVLAAGDRPIAEWYHLFETPAYVPFLTERIAAAGFATDTAVLRAWHVIQHGIPASGKGREDALSSTYNSLEAFITGPLATAFSTDDIRMEDVALGNHRLFLTGSGFSDSLLKDMVFRLTWGIVSNLAERRVINGPSPQLLAVFDETGWLTRGTIEGMETLRNRKVSLVISRQDWSANFTLAGLDGKAVATLIDRIVGSQIHFRPDDEAEAQRFIPTLRPSDPARFIERTVVSRTWGTGVTGATNWSDGATSTVGKTKTTGRNTPLNPADAHAPGSINAGASDALTTGTSRQAGGSLGHSSTEGESEAEALFRIGVDEQRTIDAEALLRTENYRFLFKVGPKTVQLTAAPPKPVPTVLFGVDLVGRLRAALAARPRTPFSPFVPPPPTPPPPPKAAKPPVVPKPSAPSGRGQHLRVDDPGKKQAK